MIALNESCLKKTDCLIGWVVENATTKQENLSSVLGFYEVFIIKVFIGLSHDIAKRNKNGS